MTAEDIRIAPTEGKIRSIIYTHVIDNVGFNELLEQWYGRPSASVSHYWVCHFTSVQPRCVKHRRRICLKQRWE
jgi:hypothetical protein